LSSFRFPSVGKLKSNIKKGGENIMSVVSQVVLQADDDLRYPSAGELNSIAEFFKTGEMRMRIATTLAESEKRIVEQASRQLWQKRPDFIAPGGNANGSRQRALCLRDYGWYMRLVTYGLISGDRDPIESIGILGAREMYNSLGVPMPGMVEGIRCLKAAALALLSEDEAAVTAPYFDVIIQGLS
jgi:allophycocyanin-B